MMKKLKRSAPALVLWLLLLSLAGSLLLGWFFGAVVSAALVLLIVGAELLRYIKENKNPNTEII